MRRFLQTKLVKSLGMFLALFGIAVTFASCYGMPPEDYRFIPDPYEEEDMQHSDSTAAGSSSVASVAAEPVSPVVAEPVAAND